MVCKIGQIEFVEFGGDLMTSRKKAKVSVIVPVYNEENTITEVLKRLLELKSESLNVEVVVVDDGSTDGTYRKLAEFNSPRVKGVRHGKNMGKGAAIRTGVDNATGDVVVIQDADLEYRPEDIPKLVDPILRGRAEAVYGSRFKGEIGGMSRSHFIGNLILCFLANLLFNSRITDVMTGHKAFLRKVLESFEIEEDGFTLEMELTARVFRGGWRIKEVPIIYSYRRHGEAKINFLDGVKCAFKILELRMGF